MKTLLRVLPLLFLVAGLVACPSSKRTNHRDTLILGVEAPVRSYDPRQAIDAYSDRVNKLLYRGLFKLNRNAEVEPDLVASYAFSKPASDGSLSLDLTLKQNVRFHSGKPFSALDVAWTYQSILQGGSPRLAGLRSVASVTAVSSDLVRFSLKEPFAPLLTALCMGIVPAESGEELARQPDGTGSFRLSSVEPNQIILERHPNAVSGLYNRFVVRTVRNDTSRSLALENGEIDVIQNALPPQDLSRFSTSEDFVVDRYDGSNISYIGFNHRDKILQDVRIRKAISLAIDRGAMLDTLLYNTAKATGSIIPRDNWAHNKAIFADPYDPVAAALLVREAGYNSENPLKITYKTSTNRLRLRIAEAIAEYLKVVGIQVEIISLDFGTFFEQVQKGAFQIYSLTWTGLTEPDILYFAFASEATPPTGANRGYYSNAKADDLVTRARYTLDKEERKGLYQSAQAIFAKDFPYAVLWQNDAILVRRKQISRIVPFPDGNFRFMEDLKLTAPAPEPDSGQNPE